MLKTINFENPYLLTEIYGNEQENLQAAEKSFGVKITARDSIMKIEGDDSNVGSATGFFESMCAARKQGMRIGGNDFRTMLEKAAGGRLYEIAQVFANPIVLNLKRRSIVPKNLNQKHYLKFMSTHEIVLGIGPAGTGKTYLAVATALRALQDKKIERIVLTRPAVEAGEALGFLPGDLQEKLLPYLRPLYDAINDMIGPEEAMRLMEKQIIEIAPLAYMRGRTLSNSFIILDEAQNTTVEQMMMFLTRLGENSRMAVTGDITQIDLPKNKKSGLKAAADFLKDVEGIKVFRFDTSDVVRHPLVTKIVNAYKEYGVQKNV